MKTATMFVAGLLVLTLVVGAGGCGGGEEVAPAPSESVTSTPTPEPITLRMITASRGTSSAGFDLFVELVEERTDGRVQIDFYPGGQLFPGTEQWEALVTGAVDILADATFWFRDAVPDMLVFYLDGVWESYEHAYTVLEASPVLGILGEKMGEAAPVKLLGILPYGMTMCLLNTVRETRDFTDLEGLRTQGSPGYPPSPLYDYSGMLSVPIAVEEVTGAFMQGMLDAVNYPPTTMLELGLVEPAKHALFYYSLFITMGIVMHMDAWESLPADIQAIILNEVMPQVYEFSKRLSREVDDAAVAELQQTLESTHWVTEEGYASYYEYLPTHSLQKVQKLMIDPELLHMVDDLRPSRQQQ